MQRAFAAAHSRADLTNQPQSNRLASVAHCFFRCCPPCSIYLGILFFTGLDRLDQPLEVQEATSQFSSSTRSIPNPTGGSGRQASAPRLRYLFLIYSSGSNYLDKHLGKLHSQAVQLMAHLLLYQPSFLP